MPRKTHKEKIMAQERKSKAPGIVFSYTATQLKSTPDTSGQSNQFAFIKKDIQKTLVLGILFIAIEIVLTLYWK